MAQQIPAQLVRFAAVGVATWGVGTVLYLVLRLVTGPFPANVVATVVGTAISTAVHARFTFGAGNAVLTGLGHLVPDASTVAESVALTAAGALVALGRFLVLRQWVFAAPNHA